MITGTIKLYGKIFAQYVKNNKPKELPASMVDDACLAYVREGEQELYSPTEKVQMKNHESILMKCGNYINKVLNASDLTPFKSLVFHLDPNSIERAFEGKDMSFLQLNNAQKLNRHSLKYSQNMQIDNLVNSMFIYFKNPNLITEELMVLKLQELVYILSDFGQNKEAVCLLRTLYIPEKTTFEEVVEANIFNNLSIRELAHLSSRSESTFKRDFKKWYKNSPAKYIKHKRLEKAAQLLKTSDQPISEIAWDCGFENAAHFSTSFLSHFNVSPKLYRMT